MATTPFKSGGSHNQSTHRGKPYALMLLLAFGAAILGVMVLHKLRERRIFSLLVKEKDQELLALHLLFQREKEFNKEARKKIEEMKTKVYSLRSQKLELDRRLSEMESIISTLRDERKVIESALQEKKREIKMLTEGGMKNSSSQELEKRVNEKEAKIEDLTLQLQKPVNTNLTSNSTEVEKGKIASGESRGLGDEEVAEKKVNETITVQGSEISEAMDLSENSRNDESEGFKGFHRGGGRRRHSKGRRWRESVLRNRRLGQSLYYVSNDNLNEVKENATTLADRYNQTRDGERDSQARQEDSKKGEEQGSSNENVKTEVGSDSKRERIAGITDNISNQKKSGEIRGELEDGELSGKPEKKQSIDIQGENKNENEQEHEGEKEAGEGEDEEDGETQEAEIDRADIQRFPESDHEDEAEETEF